MKKGTCKHFRGFHQFAKDQACPAGVKFGDVVPDPGRRQGRALRIPCVQDRTQDQFALSKAQRAEYAKRGTCPRYDEPSDAEIAAFDRAIDDHVDRMKLTLPIIGQIKQEHRGKDWTGHVTCPVCGGTLHIVHSGYNGHTRGACTGKDGKECDVAWIE